jgi:hypothetical protein
MESQILVHEIEKILTTAQNEMEEKVNCSIQL